MFREQVLEVDRLEFAQAVEVRCWSRGFIQGLIPARWITDFSCHADFNFPPALSDAIRKLNCGTALEVSLEADVADGDVGFPAKDRIAHLGTGEGSGEGVAAAGAGAPASASLPGTTLFSFAPPKSEFLMPLIMITNDAHLIP